MKELSIILDKIKNICKEKHISYSELSTLTNIPVSTLSKIMAGIIKDPSITSMIKISHALGFTIDNLMGSDETATNENVEKENVIIYHRDGKTVRKQLSKKQLEAIHTIIETMKESEEDL